MKKLNALLISIFVCLVCILPIQTIFAEDVPLKSNNDPNATTNPRPARAPGRIAVFATLNETELSVIFNNSVGIAEITIVDENGGIVYQEGIDTAVNSELLVETDGWNSETYKLKVEYGSIKLVGKFEL